MDGAGDVSGGEESQVAALALAAESDWNEFSRLRAALARERGASSDRVRVDALERLGGLAWCLVAGDAARVWGVERAREQLPGGSDEHVALVLDTVPLPADASSVAFGWAVLLSRDPANLLRRAIGVIEQSTGPGSGTDADRKYLLAAMREWLRESTDRKYAAAKRQARTGTKEERRAARKAEAALARQAEVEDLRASLSAAWSRTSWARLWEVANPDEMATFLSLVPEEQLRSVAQDSARLRQLCTSPAQALAYASRCWATATATQDVTFALWAIRQMKVKSEAEISDILTAFPWLALPMLRFIGWGPSRGADHAHIAAFDAFRFPIPAGRPRNGSDLGALLAADLMLVNCGANAEARCLVDLLLAPTPRMRAHVLREKLAARSRELQALVAERVAVAPPAAEILARYQLERPRYCDGVYDKTRDRWVRSLVELPWDPDKPEDLEAEENAVLGALSAPLRPHGRVWVGATAYSFAVAASAAGWRTASVEADFSATIKGATSLETVMDAGATVVRRYGEYLNRCVASVPDWRMPEEDASAQLYKWSEMDPEDAMRWAASGSPLDLPWGFCLEDEGGLGEMSRGFYWCGETEDELVQFLFQILARRDEPDRPPRLVNWSKLREDAHGRVPLTFVGHAIDAYLSGAHIAWFGHIQSLLARRRLGEKAKSWWRSSGRLERDRKSVEREVAPILERLELDLDTDLSGRLPTITVHTPPPAGTRREAQRRRRG